jgi:superfamily II DNA or RNA helicase
MTTDYHAKLYAHELLRRCPSDSVERFTAALMDSQVDLNPHQVDAALFAFRSPLSKGAILADEVGLGKTIEAGIVLSQKWAERRRKILIILPSSLRKQWHQELLEKFYLPSQILEARTFNKALKNGARNPFDIPEIVICSYHFARNKAEYVRAIHWDLVVIDEAHRLRNVYKTGNKIARELKQALEHAPKILLTATPLQNSLLELYGLVSFIDEHAFGDLKSFRTQFARLSSDDSFDDLKQRLKPICKRTLRRQVLEYIRFTERKAYTQEFIPSKEEEVLYDMVSEYLRRHNLYALPTSQRSLMTLVLRKLLASSTFAIAGALDTLANKLERRLREDESLRQEEQDLEDDFETYEELADELEINEEEPPEPLTEEEREAIQEEINELRSFFELAMQISQNAKGESLLQALDIGFRMTVDLGGAEKAVIFTESRRTQNYLAKLLSENGYADESENMRSTRQKLLENFDAEVAEKLNVYKAEATASLNRYEALLWETTRHALEGYASFDDKALTFRLNRVPENGIPLGVHTLKRQERHGHHYRLQHPLARWVLKNTSRKKLPAAELIFDYSGSSRNISILKKLVGKSGILTAVRMTVKALEAEDYIIVAAVTMDGHELDAEQARRLFSLQATAKSIGDVPDCDVNLSYVRQKNAILSDISERNAIFFEEEMDKLNRWAEDKRKSLKSTLKDYDDQIADLKKQARMAPNLPEKLALQKRIRSLDKKRDNAWREYDEAAREIERQKDALIDQVEARLGQEIEEEELFTIQWRLI